MGQGGGTFEDCFLGESDAVTDVEVVDEVQHLAFHGLYLIEHGNYINI